MAKNNEKTLSDLAGGAVKASHHAYLVRTGKLDLAVEFFKELKWVEDSIPVSDDWGRARFLHLPATDSRIQLSEYYDRPIDMVECSDGTHLALCLMRSASDLAIAIGCWSIKKQVCSGLKIDQADATGTKWFVYIPEVFTFAIEVVQVKAFPTP